MSSPNPTEVMALALPPDMWDPTEPDIPAFEEGPDQIQIFTPQPMEDDASSPTPSAASTILDQPPRCPHHARYDGEESSDNIPYSYMWAMRLLFGCHCTPFTLGVSDCDDIAAFLAAIYQVLPNALDPDYDGTLGLGEENGELMPPFMTLHPDVTRQLIWPRNQFPRFVQSGDGDPTFLGEKDDAACWWDTQKIFITIENGEYRYKLNNDEAVALGLVCKKLFSKLHALNNFRRIASQIGDDLQDAPCACLHVLNLSHPDLPTLITRRNPGATAHTLPGYSVAACDLNIFRSLSFASIRDLRAHIYPLLLWSHFMHMLADLAGTKLADRGLPRFNPVEAGISPHVRYLTKDFVQRMGGSNNLIPQDWPWIWLP